MQKGQIRFAAMSITWNNPVGEDFIPWLADVKEAGYEGISCFAGKLDEFMDHPSGLKEQLEKLGLALASVSAVLNEDFARYRQVLSFMKEVGCSILVCIDPAGTEKQYAKYAELLNQIGGLAAQDGIQVFYHNHTDSVGETYSDMEQLIALLDPDRVSLMLDTGHATKDFVEFPYEERAVRFLEAYWERIRFMEWKDWNETTGLNTPLGEGYTDYDRIFALIRQRGYSGWVTIEQNGNEGWSRGRSPSACAALSRRFVREKLGV